MITFLAIYLIKFKKETALEKTHLLASEFLGFLPFLPLCCEKLDTPLSRAVKSQTIYQTKITIGK
jgi:hypothetical protein